MALKVRNTVRIASNATNTVQLVQNTGSLKHVKIFRGGEHTLYFSPGHALTASVRVAAGGRHVRPSDDKCSRRLGHCWSSVRLRMWGAKHYVHVHVHMSHPVSLSRSMGMST